MQKERGDGINIYTMLALFAGILTGANFAVVILAFLGANHVDSDK